MKRSLVVVAAAAAVISLAGCGGGAKEAGTSGSSSVNSSSSSTTQASVATTTGELAALIEPAVTKAGSYKVTAGTDKDMVVLDVTRKGDTVNFAMNDPSGSGERMLFIDNVLYGPADGKPGYFKASSKSDSESQIMVSIFTLFGGLADPVGLLKKAPSTPLTHSSSAAGDVYGLTEGADAVKITVKDSLPSTLAVTESGETQTLAFTAWGTNPTVEAPAPDKIIK